MSYLTTDQIERRGIVCHCKERDFGGVEMDFALGDFNCYTTETWTWLTYQNMLPIDEEIILYSYQEWLLSFFIIIWLYVKKEVRNGK